MAETDRTTKRPPRDLPERQRATALAAIADSLSGRALEVTMPVYRTDNRGRLAAEGTAMLLSLGSIRFLVTAAHVFDGLRPDVLAVPAGGVLAPIVGDVTYLYGLPAERRAEDLVDVRIVRLSGPVWDAVPVSAFLRWDELDHEPANPRRHAFALLGYPATKQRRALKGTTLEARAYRVLALECPSAVYTTLEVDPKVSLLVGFEQRRTWSPDGMRTAPNLHGVSGGGLWRFGRHLRDAVAPPHLSAIAVRWERGQIKYVRGTRIRPILAAIAQRYPDARSIIHSHLGGTA
jgi:hypothetical protein